ncbi:hypothetical protein RRG08_017948 [Elysia crispata]|uniref:ATP-dependent DNA helicase n=1 Tax=Elysia crispata TaxID=231223 RepID=A0AAE0ZD46_9GAST|nr:hypothetical protein RRG08_017948 [Elysia crispata]
MGIDSYPKCKRSDAQSGGNTEVKKVAGEEVTIDNSWIVPIEQSWNVELCASIKCIKYVLKRVHKGADRATFRIQREGGREKTFLIVTLLTLKRAQSKIAIATASLGLTATLLSGGKTLQNAFIVPLNIINTEMSVCTIKKGTTLLRVLQEPPLLIVDEATLLHGKIS